MTDKIATRQVCDLVGSGLVKPDQSWCPRCGASELHPTLKDSVLIRGLKVHDEGYWWSQCLVCAGYYDVKLNLTPTRFNDNLGWFHD